ncbi:MAG TPA: hypothetical protein VFC46_16605 [Humisphaera sp.]|nr:hypothetical protein [Humisphaera sp.]
MHDPQELAKACYRMAYFVLPRYAFEGVEKVDTQLSKGTYGAAFFYVMTCQLAGIEPDKEAAHAFVVHTGELDPTHRYHVIQYPPPAPIPDVMSLPKEQLIAAMKTVVLAPYFSAVLVDNRTGEVECYVLGQSPESATSFRRVTSEFNANLGPGCDPKLEPFLALLRERKTRKAIAGVGTPRGAHSLGVVKERPWWKFWS